MVISSLIVEVLPERLNEVSEALLNTLGVEVHGTEKNQIVVTIEAETLDDSHGIASSFVGIEGVIGINLVYTNFEDDLSLQIPKYTRVKAEGRSEQDFADDNARSSVNKTVL